MGGKGLAKVKLGAAFFFCLLSAAGCGGAGGGSSNWFQNGFQFARNSVAKGEPSDNASNFVNGSKGDRWTWCDNAYSSTADPGAPARKVYEGVTTNAPAHGNPYTTAEIRTYDQWVSGCAAGLLNAKS